MSIVLYKQNPFFHKLIDTQAVLKNDQLQARPNSFHGIARYFKAGKRHKDKSRGFWWQTRITYLHPYPSLTRCWTHSFSCPSRCCCSLVSRLLTVRKCFSRRLISGMGNLSYTVCFSATTISLLGGINIEKDEYWSEACLLNTITTRSIFVFSLLVDWSMVGYTPQVL